MVAQVYPRDLTDTEWALLAPLVPPAKSGGRPRSVDLRQILNGLFYLVRSGCAWSLGAPCRATTAPGLRCTTPSACGDKLASRPLGTAPAVAPGPGAPRQRAGREPTPRAAIIDRQSVKTQQGGPRGFDGAKKVNGRKRHLVVDTRGLLPAQGRRPSGGSAARSSWGPAGLGGSGWEPTIPGCSTSGPINQGYAGAGRGGAGRGGAVCQWTKDQLGIDREVVYPWWRQLQRYFPDLLDDLGFQSGFHVLPRPALGGRADHLVAGVGALGGSAKTTSAFRPTARRWCI